MASYSSWLSSFFQNQAVKKHENFSIDAEALTGEVSFFLFFFILSFFLSFFLSFCLGEGIVGAVTIL